jgi:beta-galactosidase
MKLRICIPVLFAMTLSVGAQATRQHPASQITVDASAPIQPPERGYLHLGGTSSTGHSLQVNSQYLVLDGKPWLPVMGEFHFSRYPESEWEDEILKMKAGGINIISTYIFWIHQEEIEGQFDWSGQRNLRRFVELCSKHGMYVWLRVGPWAHGEVRNGGFPDWIVKLPNIRTNDPVYLHYVERFFNQIGAQVHGFMFKDGGPVIGTQLENEYGLHGPGRGAEHILRLKQLAIAAGIDTPLYSVTGWPSLDFPPQEVVPVSGGYPDGFWYGSRTNLPPSVTYLFNFSRELGDMGATVASEDPNGKVDLKHDPYFAAEEGGGMASAYHRRPVLSADDIAALTLTGLGSGINLYGYYMFHGGANPKGKLTTLQESSATGYPNDLPEVTYDFEAPLGEFGQARESYRKTRMLHLFLNAYGSQLATMPAFAPAQRTRDAANTSMPRVAVRTDGRSGFVFVNNYVRQLAMADHPGFQVRIKLPASEILVPAHPVDLPAGRYFAWPFQLAIGKSVLHYSTAQLLTQLETPRGKLIVFFAVPGIESEFSFDSSTLQRLSAPRGAVSQASGATVVRNLRPGMNSTIQLTDSSGAKATILLLSQDEAEDTALLHVAGADHLMLSESTLFASEDRLHLQSSVSPRQEVAILPDLSFPGTPSRTLGLWKRYSFAQPEKHPTLSVAQSRTAGPPPPVTMGPYIDWRKTAVPLVPPDSAFAQAATWQIQWTNPDMAGLSDALLQIEYAGEIGRIESTPGLLDDDFYNGLPWQIGLKRFGMETIREPFKLQVLPLPPADPIYLDQHARDQLRTIQISPKLIQVKLIPVYESVAIAHAR